MKGRMAKDDICFQLGKCLNIDFLYVDKQTGWDASVDAIIGFARAEERFILEPGSTKRKNFNDTSVLQALKDYGEEPIFSTRFQRDFISWIDIGTPDDSQNKTAAYTIDTFNDFFWSTTL